MVQPIRSIIAVTLASFWSPRVPDRAAWKRPFKPSMRSLVRTEIQRLHHLFDGSMRLVALDRRLWCLVRAGPPAFQLASRFEQQLAIAIGDALHQAIARLMTYSTWLSSRIETDGVHSAWLSKPLSSRSIRRFVRPRARAAPAPGRRCFPSGGSLTDSGVCFDLVGPRRESRPDQQPRRLGFFVASSISYLLSTSQVGGLILHD